MKIYSVQIGCISEVYTIGAERHDFETKVEDIKLIDGIVIIYPFNGRPFTPKNVHRINYLTEEEEQRCASKS